MKRMSLILGLGCLLFMACAPDEDRFELLAPKELVRSEQLHDKVKAIQTELDDCEYDSLVQKCQDISFYRGKSVAYLGASLVNLEECDVAKYMVAEALDCSITSYGHGGYGFASEFNLQPYVEHIRKHDVYVIWGTTNDYFLDVPIGSPTYCTPADGFDLSKRNTVSGGLNYIIYKIRAVNPNALILGFTMTKIFNSVILDGSILESSHTNPAGFHFYDYVEAHKNCFQLAGIPCLDVWNWEGFGHANWTEFYQEDGVHLKEKGYYKLGKEHLKFLMQQGQSHTLN